MLARRFLPFVVVFSACGRPAAPPAPSRESLAPADLRTEAEKSSYRRTGRYDEVERLCKGLAETYPGRTRCFSFGTTPEGRSMWALAASANGVLEPAAARRTRRPVVLIQGGIHAGEIDGKDAGFAMMRELLAGEIAPAALAATTVVFVPVFNVDGHERFGKNHRPNQRGPEEMGFRTTAGNLNLNRDYVKADAPEMRAMLTLIHDWDPVMTIDLHATDGAKFQHDVAVMVEPFIPRGDGLERVGVALDRVIQSRLKLLGHLPLPFYPAFKADDDPSSGFDHIESLPRFSTGYAAARNRLGVLVETHSWATYERRVDATRDLLQIVLERATAEATGWRAAADRADAVKLAGREIVLAFEAGGEPETIDFLGYAYERKPSEVSGTTWISYDESKPEVWRVPLFEKQLPKLTVKAPGAGYLVPAGWAPRVEEVLKLHGVEYRQVEAGESDAETFRASQVTYKGPFEGRQTATVVGTWSSEKVSWPAGSLFVPIEQARGRLVLHLFEPLAPDSFVSWGTFNAAFEQKEYMEAYVTEAEARRMLKEDAALAASFEEKLRTDPAFKASPSARLDFFYTRHPAHDERHMRVPTYKLAAAPR